jgi:hypothetical protein
VAIASNPETKGLCGKARTLKQAVDKNFGIDFGIDADRSAHECASLEHHLSVSSNDIQLAMADPCVSHNRFHCPSPNHAAGCPVVGHLPRAILAACRRAAPLHWTLILSNNSARSG